MKDDDAAPAAPTAAAPDFLDEIVAEGEARSPGFAAKVDDAYARRVNVRGGLPPDAESFARVTGAKPTSNPLLPGAWVPVGKAPGVYRDEHNPKRWLRVDLSENSQELFVQKPKA